MRKGFDPNQPRNPHGEWTRGGAVIARMTAEAQQHLDRARRNAQPWDIPSKPGARFVAHDRETGRGGTNWDTAARDMAIGETTTATSQRGTKGQVKRVASNRWHVNVEGSTREYRSAGSVAGALLAGGHNNRNSRPLNQSQGPRRSGGEIQGARRQRYAQKVADRSGIPLGQLSERDIDMAARDENMPDEQINRMAAEYNRQHRLGSRMQKTSPSDYRMAMGRKMTVNEAIRFKNRTLRRFKLAGFEVHFDGVGNIVGVTKP
jgi:hypothetical protein